MYGFNLSTYSYTNGNIKAVLYILLFLITITFSIYNYKDYIAVEARVAGTLVQIENLKKDMTVLKKDMKEKVGNVALGDKKGRAKLSEKIEFLNAVIAENRFSWSELFYSLEKASPYNLSITSIKPSYASKKITISGVAKYSKDVALLVENLQGTTFIQKSFLIRESEKIIDKRYKTISFDIEAEGVF